MDNVGALVAGQGGGLAAGSPTPAPTATQLRRRTPPATPATASQAFTTDTAPAARRPSTGSAAAPRQRDETALWAALRQAGGDARRPRATLQPNIVVIAGQNDNVSGGDESAAHRRVGQRPAARVRRRPTPAPATTGAARVAGRATNGGQRRHRPTTGTERRRPRRARRTGRSTTSSIVTYVRLGRRAGQVADLDAHRRRRRPPRPPSPSAASSTGCRALRPDGQSTSVRRHRVPAGRPRAARSPCCSCSSPPPALAYALIMLVRARTTASSTCCSPTPRATARAATDDDEDDSGFAKTALVQRAVELTEQVRRAAGLPEPGRGRARAGRPPAAGRRGAVLLRRRRRGRSRSSALVLTGGLIARR